MTNKDIPNQTNKSVVNKFKGIIRRSSFETIPQQTNTVEDEEYTRKLIAHNKKIDIIMAMEEEEIENLQIFVHKLNLQKQRKVHLEETQRKLVEANQRFQQQEEELLLSPSIHKKSSRRVSFNNELPKYKEAMESRKFENWWEKNFGGVKKIAIDIVRTKLINYFMIEMSHSEIVANFLFDTYIRDEISLEDSEYITLEELKDHTHMKTINDYFEERSNKITKFHIVCSSDDYDLETVFTEDKSVDGYNVIDAEGLTPLHYACSCDISPQKIKFLLKNKSDPNIKNNVGETPLHSALRNVSQNKTINYLLKYKADPNIKAKEEMNSLHVCCSIGNYDEDLIKLLLNFKCDPYALDNNKLKPLDYAKDSDNYSDLEDLLK